MSNIFNLTCQKQTPCISPHRSIPTGSPICQPVFGSLFFHILRPNTQGYLWLSFSHYPTPKRTSANPANSYLQDVAQVWPFPSASVGDRLHLDYPSSPQPRWSSYFCSHPPPRLLDSGCCVEMSLLQSCSRICHSSAQTSPVASHLTQDKH